MCGGELWCEVFVNSFKKIRENASSDGPGEMLDEASGSKTREIVETGGRSYKGVETWGLIFMCSFWEVRNVGRVSFWDTGAGMRIPLTYLKWTGISLQRLVESRGITRNCSFRKWPPLESL